MFGGRLSAEVSKGIELLLSMTGFGEAKRQSGELTVAVEIRTVNNRYLKVQSRLADVYAPLEGAIERVVRERIGRGSVNVTVRADRQAKVSDYEVNTVALNSYLDALEAVARKRVPSHLATSSLAHLLTVPGVVVDRSRSGADAEADWPLIEQVLVAALEKLEVFRKDEGLAMDRDMRANVAVVAAKLDEVAALAPRVVEEYRAKMLERVRQALKETEARVTESDLVREVAIFADRADINEEITRLKCHLEQFGAFLDAKESTGRKLDFLVQEMNREVNTIGSKANSVGIAHAVVEMKTAVERIREVLQNVE